MVRIIFDSPTGSDRTSKIKFGNENNSPRELIKSDDLLNVDPSWFAGVRQSDAYSCTYFVLTGLQRMQSDRTAFREGGSAMDEVQAKVVANFGLGNLKKHIQEGRTNQLSSVEFRDRLLEIGSPDSQVFATRDGLPFNRDNVLSGIIAAEAVKRGFGVGVELHDRGHLVLAIGVSRDGKEMVCWDPMLGDPDIKYPDTLLRRVPAESEQVYMWGGLLLSETYKASKSTIETPAHTASSVEPRPHLTQFAENRRGLWDRIKDFASSF